MGSNNNSRKPANDGFTSPVKAKASGKSGKSSLVPVICMVLVLALCVGAIVWTKVADSGIFYRNTISLSSENFEVNNAMLQYFFNLQYQNMSSSMKNAGVVLTANLKGQKYTSTMDWFDYLMQNVTIPHVQEILVLCEAAKAANFELSEADKAEIDEAMDQLEAMSKSYANAYGGSKNYYIRSTYGYGINMSDIRAAMELNQLAAAYSESLIESYEFTAEEWDAYLEEHRDDFLVVDYLTYKFVAEEKKKDDKTTTSGTEAITTEVSSSASDETTGTDEEDEKEEERTEEQQKAYDLAQALIEKLKADPENAKEVFNTEIKKYLEDVVYADEDDADKKADKVEAALESTVNEAVVNDETNAFMKFAFDEKRTESVYLDEDNKDGEYTVYCITKAPYIEDYVTRNIRVIVLSASGGDKIEEERDAILEEFEKGDKDEPSFEALAKKHSDDSSVKDNGGLYEDQGKFDLGIDELNEWLFDEDRKVGDYTSVSNGKSNTSEVIYIAFYSGEGMIKWQRDVDSAMTAEEYADEVEALKKVHAVTTDLSNAYKIPCQAGL